jgi:hypothetical protein
METEFFGNLIMFLGLSIIIFAILRWFVLWYFRIDEIVKILKDIRDDKKKECSCRKFTS